MLVIKDRAHMSIGREFSIMVDHSQHYPYECWQYGDGYNYGMLPPRYPVPATLFDNWLAREDHVLIGWRHARNMD
jgi:hypothetical protein